jgi:acyl carrier protein
VNPTVQYHTIALDTLAHDQPQLVAGLLDEVLAAFGRGDWHCLPRRDYPLAEAQAAFRYMAQARHIGKIVIVPPMAAPVRSAVMVPASNGAASNGATPTSAVARPIGQVRAAVLAASVEDRPRLVEEYLRESVARALDVPPADVDADARLNDLGFDSLMAVEVKNHLELDLGVNFNLAGFLEGPTLAGLVTHVLGQLDETTPAVVHQAASAPLDPQQLLDNIDSLSDDEVDSLLNKMLAEVGEATDG